MLGEELSRALSDISDDKIERAAGIVPKSRSNIWLRVAAAAAVAAIVLTAALWPREDDPGLQLGSQPVQGTETPTAPTETKGYELTKLANVVKMYSYNQEGVPGDKLKEYEVTDTVTYYDQHWIEMLKPVFGIRFSFQLPEEIYEGADIKIKLYTPYGDFAVLDEETGNRVVVGKNAETRTNEMVAWHPQKDVEALKENNNPGALYLRVFIYADDHIVGFGLVELGCNYILDGSYYAVTLLRFVTFCYPKIDGQFQNVSYEYILNQIEEYEQSMSAEYMQWNEKYKKDMEGE